jgi:hypothetical protein
VAEKHGIPWVSVMHVPRLLYSIYDPPILPGFPGVSKQLHRLGPLFWKPAAQLIRSVTRRWAKPLDRFRAEIDTPAYSYQASRIAEQVRQEDGVRSACDALEASLPSGNHYGRIAPARSISLAV